MKFNTCDESGIAEVGGHCASFVNRSWRYSSRGGSERVLKEDHGQLIIR